MIVSLGNWQPDDDILLETLLRGKLQSMRELIRLKANLYLQGSLRYGTLLYHATLRTNVDGTRNHEFVEYLLSDELMKDWCKNDLVEHHGLNDDELKLYNDPNPIKKLLDCKADTQHDAVGRSRLF
jgi:hypothetical protein